MSGRSGLLTAILVSLSIILSGCGTRGSVSEPGASPTALTTRPAAARLGPTSTASTTPTLTTSTTATPTLAPIPPITTDDLARGPEDAPATLIVYSDFDCDLCATVAATLQLIQQDHVGQVRLAFRPFPLLGAHDKAGLAAAAVLAAPDAKAAWAMHDLLFENRASWRDLDPVAFQAWLGDQADSIGLDPSTYRASLTADDTVSAVNRAYEKALASGIPGVPFVLLNGRPIVHSLDHGTLEASVRLAILQQTKFDAPEPVLLPPAANVLARLHFNFGTITVRLYPSAAPQAVNSFLFLADKGWYDGSALYLIEPGVLVEGGDPTNTGLGDAGYHFDLELDPSLSFSRPGMLAMDNEGPGTNSARFFINLSPRPAWDGSFTIFGHVMDGLAELDHLEARDPIDDLLEPPQAVLRSIDWEAE